MSLKKSLPSNSVVYAGSISRSRDVWEKTFHLVKDRNKIKSLLQPRLQDWMTEPLTVRKITEINRQTLSQTKSKSKGQDPSQEEALETIMDQFLTDKVIRLAKPEETVLLMPIFTVKKPNGKSRLIYNAKPWNRFAKADYFSLETIQAFRELISPNCQLTGLDLKKGFYQIGIHPDSQWMTGFIHKTKRYVYQALPMGLTCSPYIFQTIVRLAIRPLREQECS